MKDNGTFVSITKTDHQTTPNIIDTLVYIGVPRKHININKYNELVMTVAKKGTNTHIGIALNIIRALVSPAVVRMFDSYLDDNGGEERIYYDC